MALPPLAPEDFPAFFEAVQRWDSTAGEWRERAVFPPFPWQARLIDEIAIRRRWPDLLDLPTGAGKTAAIDIAVFHLALEADRGTARRAAMRMAFVVDRRLVVDEAFARARRLAAALLDAVQPKTRAPTIVCAVAERLRHLAGQDAPPLVARALRGGAPREDDWARTPCQPTVLSSTVDQVGSRLLFRGYGVSNSMKPVHAGLLGSDALILLDEAHLSQPFRQTAQAIGLPAIRGSDDAPFQVSLLTATPGASAEDEWRFSLGDDDRADPILSKRLRASKPAVLREVSERARAAALAEEARKLVDQLKAGGVATPVVGVIANRVARARTAFERLKAELGETATVTLVIGRARGVDRDKTANELAPIKTGVEPRPSRPFVVVATQTLEVGVDVDLDALVTDAAALDALRQRFGRVNRNGRDVAASGVILADKTDRKPKKDGDPIYGEAIAETLKELFPEGGEEVDFGPEALDATLAALVESGKDISLLLSNRADAPVLMPAYVDLWTHTAPLPAVEPDPALFLHGPNREPVSVQLVWRADLDLALDNEHLRALLSLVPPLAAEAVELPVWAVRRWLLSEDEFDVADVAAAEEGETVPDRPKGPVFCWRGADDDRSRILSVEEIRRNGIRPGDLVVVPAEYGGCDAYGWNPDRKDREPVADVYDEASAPFEGRRYVVRVAPGLIRQAVFEDAEHEERDPLERKAAREDRLKARADRIAAEVETALGELGPTVSAAQIAEALEEVVPEQLGGRLRKLRECRKRWLERPAFPYGGDDGRRPGVVLRAPFGLTEGRDKVGISEGNGAGTEDDDVGSFDGRAQRLVTHSRDVEACARLLAEKAGLPEKWVADLALAGWLHDAGKADLRFQRLLFNGNLLEMEAKEPLAKSARGRSDPGARERAKLPDRWRHEALSVRLALANPRLQKAYDRALVLWLVGVHHGHGRPFFPHEDPCDGEDRALAAVAELAKGALPPGIGPQSLAFVIEGEPFGPTEHDPNDLRGLDWPTMFRDLKRRYGPWGLARLEAVLRLADHRASEAARQSEAQE
ncbi:MAG TPA: type I-U CRISPR-associated helicase/endonuclease Cas3 [Hyphomicrobiales bacterium]|nr:type I-U CRISPR-associated helicase/endonuclease Cas3 [Hyphomicrobiales bacterium]